MQHFVYFLALFVFGGLVYASDQEVEEDYEEDDMDVGKNQDSEEDYEEDDMEFENRTLESKIDNSMFSLPTGSLLFY